MKKRVLSLILIVATLCVSMFCYTGCNNQIFDTTYKFHSAMILMPDGTVITGEVDSWKDYDNCDAIQVKIDGKTYYTHLRNVILINQG